MSKETDRKGRPIKTSTRQEIANEISGWQPECVLALCVELLYCHHAADWRNIANKIKEDYDNEIKNS